MRGYRAEVKRFRGNWSPRLTAIPIVCTDGFLDIAIHRGTTDRFAFLDFVQNHLAPNLLPFNGTNPRSVVIMGKYLTHTRLRHSYFVPLETLNKYILLL